MDDFKSEEMSKTWKDRVVTILINLAIIVIAGIVVASAQNKYDSNTTMKDKVDCKVDKRDFEKQLEKKVDKDVFNSYLKNQESNQEALHEIQSDIKTILKEMPKR